MIRSWSMLLLVLATAGAGAPPPLPIPPIPPSDPPSDQAAPVPDVDARAPFRRGPEGAQLSPSLFRYNNRDASMGYVPGSRVQTSDDRKIIPAPGFTLHVPIQ